MHSRAIEAVKPRLVLTERQRAVLVGTLLGDGHLETKDHGRTYRLKIEHSLKQRDYVHWKYLEFQSLVRTPPQQRDRLVELKGNRAMYSKFWFNTLSLGTFRFYAQQFYRGRKRIVPRLIRRWLTPLALAVWYMDDGSIKSAAHRTVFLNTHAFGPLDVQRLQQVLFQQYGVGTTLREQPEGTQIYVGSGTVDVFLRTIEPFMLPSMRYKLPQVWLTSLPKM